MTFDAAFERSHKPNTTMNADDKTIHDLLLEWGTVGNVEAFRQSVVSYITAIRKEARAAAFKDTARTAAEQIAEVYGLRNQKDVIASIIEKSNTWEQEPLDAETQTHK